MRTRIRFGVISSMSALVAALLFTSGPAHAQTDGDGAAATGETLNTEDASRSEQSSLP